MSRKQLSQLHADRLVMYLQSITMYILTLLVSNNLFENCCSHLCAAFFVIKQSSALDNCVFDLDSLESFLLLKLELSNVIVYVEKLSEFTSSSNCVKRLLSIASTNDQKSMIVVGKKEEGVRLWRVSSAESNVSIDCLALRATDRAVRVDYSSDAARITNFVAYVVREMPSGMFVRQLFDARRALQALLAGSTDVSLWQLVTHLGDSTTLLDRGWSTFAMINDLRSNVSALERAELLCSTAFDRRCANACAQFLLRNVALNSLPSDCETLYGHAVDEKTTKIALVVAGTPLRLTSDIAVPSWPVFAILSASLKKTLQHYTDDVESAFEFHVLFAVDQREREVFSESIAVAWLTVRMQLERDLPRLKIHLLFVDSVHYTHSDVVGLVDDLYLLGVWNDVGGVVLDDDRREFASYRDTLAADLARSFEYFYLVRDTTALLSVDWPSVFVTQTVRSCGSVRAVDGSIDGIERNEMFAQQLFLSRTHLEQLRQFVPFPSTLLPQALLCASSLRPSDAPNESPVERESVFAVSAYLLASERG
jgi:hypothetical protein